MSEPKKITITYRVPYADTDQMHVVYYANYLVLFERCRNEMMRAAGLTYKELEARGFALPVSEACVHYHRSATYDDLLEISGWIGPETHGPRLQICCEVRRDGVLLADGHTVHAFVDIHRMRPVRPPAEILAALGFAPAAAPFKEQEANSNNKGKGE